MLQTFPKHQADWSETVVNVPASFYRTVTANTVNVKNQIIFSFYFFIPIRNLIFALTNQTNHGNIKIKRELIPQRKRNH